MDIEFLKEVIRVVAQHGPWAIFCFWLAYKLFEHNKAMAEALTRTAVALEGLSLRIEALKPKGATP